MAEARNQGYFGALPVWMGSRFALLALAAFAGLLLSKGPALVPGFALDDYAVLGVPRSIEFTLSQGRFTQALLQLIVNLVDVSATHAAWTATLIFFAAAGVAIALGLDYASRGRGSMTFLLALSALLGAHPYLTEYFTFREALLPQGFAFLLLALVMWRASGEILDRDRRLLSAPSIALLVLLAGCQQTTYIVAVCFFLGRLALDLGNERLAVAWARNRSALNAVAVSAAAYVAVAFAARAVFGAVVPVDERGLLISVAELPHRAEQLGDLAVLVLARGEAVLSQPIKAGVLLILVAGLVATALRDRRTAFIWAGFSLLMLALSLALVGLSKVWWPVPRAIFATAFASATMLAVVYTRVGGRMVTAAALVIAACALASAMKSNQILLDQGRLNRWDQWVARVIVEWAMERGFAEGDRIRIVGAGWRHLAGPMTIQGDLNASALAKDWAVAGVFREATGREFNVRSEQYDAAVCGGRPAFPARDSMFRVGGGFVVCMQ